MIKFQKHTLSALFLVGLLTFPGCGTEPEKKPAAGIDFLDHAELMGAPRADNGMEPIGSEAAAIMLGQVTRRAVEFPSGRFIAFSLPEIPDGARFTGAVGVKTFVADTPGARFQVSRRAPNGVETVLDTITAEAGEEETWHPFSIPLDEFKGLSITLSVRAVVDSRVGKVYLANPRLVVPSDEAPSGAILICIDTLRADHVGCYGAQLPLTPSLDAFAQEAVRFGNCETACPWTLPSVAAVFTGRYPGQIAADAVTEHLRNEETTIPELFHRKGFRTGSITNNHYVSSEVGFFQGVEYQHESPRATADREYGWALEWIRDHMDEDFFLYIHLFDAHLPYEPLEPFLSQYRQGSGRFETSFSEVTEYREGTLTITDQEKLQIHGLYNGCVAFADQETGKFFDELKQMGIWDNTAVVVFADHGEEFWEHGGYEHGHCVYEEVTHVPLLARFPGREPGVVDRRVSLIDVLPTFIGWAGLETPAGIMGRDLFGTESQEASPRRFLIEGCIHATESRACIQDDWKQIVHFDGATGPELYDLAVDPLEKDNRVNGEQNRADELSSEIVIYSAQTSEGCHFRLYPTEEAPNGTFTVTATTANGKFSDVRASSTGSIETENVEDSRLEYGAQFRRGGYFGLDFMIEPEDAEVTFSASFGDNPDVQFPWYLGASAAPFTAGEYTISMTDPRIAMSYPQARLTTSEGVYIWSVPPSVRASMEGTLSPETIEELVSLGYITPD